MKLFLDTNIVLDLLDSTRKHHAFAKALIRKTALEDHAVVISEDMLTTIYYIAKNKAAVLGFFETALAEWEVRPFGAEVIAQAVSRCQKEPQLDFEDAIQCLCARANGCDALITHDQDFGGCEITILSAEGFLNP